MEKCVCVCVCAHRCRFVLMIGVSHARERSDRAGGGCGRGDTPSDGRYFFQNESIKIAF